jgi:WD40 repeat protein
VIQILERTPSNASSVAFHPGGKHLASVGADKLVKVWDLTPAWRCSPISATSRTCSGRERCGVQSRRPTIAAGNEGSVKIWDWQEHRLLHTFGGRDNFRINVAFSRDGRQLASGNWWGNVQLWDPATGGEPLRNFSENREVRHPVSAVAFSPDGGRLAAASFERRVNVWDTTTGGLVHVLPHSGLVLCVAYSPDGRRIASAGEDKIVHFWEATTGRELLGLSGHTGMCGCVAFSPDGRRLASGSTDHTIRIWDATALEGHEGSETLTFREHSNEIWSLAVSPDGQRVVSAGFSSPPKVWDAQSGHVITDFPGHRVVVFCVSWQPDGKRIASAGADGRLCTVKVWDAQTGQDYFTLADDPPGPEFFAVAFSPDGKYLATGRQNRTVQIWDARTGNPIVTLGTHDRVVRGVVFSSDGRHLASGQRRRRR